jgi:hypothetical protein
MSKTIRVRRSPKKPFSYETYRQQFNKFAGNMKGKKTMMGCPCCKDIENIKESIMKKIHREEIRVATWKQ